MKTQLLNVWTCFLNFYVTQARKTRTHTHEKKTIGFTDLVFSPNNSSPTNLYLSPKEQRQYFNAET